MDFVESERELRKISESQRKLTHRYADIRNQYGQAKWDLILLLIPHQNDDRYRKASWDKQVQMLLADTPENHKTEVYGIAEKYTKCKEQYKGIDKMIEMRSSRITAIQSLRRYAREND